LTAAFAAVFSIASLAPASAQTGGGLSIPIVGAGQAGSTGVLRITQFALLDERTAVAIGTLSIGATGGNGNRTIVTQVAVPLIGVTSAGGRPGGIAIPATGAGGTQASGLPGTTGGTGQAGVGFPAASAPVPGQLTTCGPLRVTLGPVSVARQGLAVNVPRLDIDIDDGTDVAVAATASQGPSMLGSAICSAHEALAASNQAAAGFAVNVVAGTAGTGVAGAAGTGLAGSTGTGATGTAGTGGAATSGTTATGTGQASALQNLVAALNGVLGSM
jgi:hypothetical protein